MFMNYSERASFPEPLGGLKDKQQVEAEMRINAETVSRS